MTILSAIRDRLSGRHASAQWEPTRDAQGNPVAEPPVPFAGYEGLDDREVVDGLSDHSQVELEAVESYERSHQDREPVLDKLRFMRQREPLPGYDAMSVEEIATALGAADVDTIKKVRGYERKFANRPDVVEEAVRLHHERREAEPAAIAPGYQPMSATSETSSGRDRTEGER